ncbi:hypothetical protein AB0L41_12510 [Amycolatopsis mediterranei]|uniref:hypothetical protein n=1 Tax=Amycolatopsis mediterranei TaxID=33910 RepID=UPI003417F669
MNLTRCLVAAAALLALAACSNPAPPSGQVATMSTPGTSDTGKTAAATPSAEPDNGRPRERLDMTNEDLEALNAPYLACLTQNGSPKGRKGSPGSGPSAAPVDGQTDQQAEEKAEAACLSKSPLPPWELDSSNPHAADFVHAVVQCLRGKGVRYVDEEPPQGDREIYSFGGPQNDAASISKGMSLAPECEKEVAAKGIGK